jgi:hypothetical protein
VRLGILVPEERLRFGLIGPQHSLAIGPVVVPRVDTDPVREDYGVVEP